MKKFMFLVLFPVIIITLSIFSSEFGLFTSTVEIKRPSHLPKNLPKNWGVYEQIAYESGRLSYNIDSTICIIKTDRNLTQDHAKRVQLYNEYYDKWNSDSAVKAREKNPTWYIREFNK